MSPPHNLLRVSVDLDAIQANFRLLQTRQTCLMPVVKADAYGHGLIPVAQALELCGARYFAVGTVDEALALRPAVQGSIVALLGPQCSGDAAALAQEENIVAVAARLDQLRLLQDAAVARDTLLRVGLKFDTGMARLGFTSKDLPEVLDRLGHCQNLRAEWLLSHLAVADDPSQAEFTREQGQRFAGIHAGLQAKGLDLRGSLVNSAGLMAFPELLWQGQRPGIALYGANPFHDTELAHLGHGLRPAMQVQAPVLAVHALSKGTSISYGRTYVADEDKIVAIVGAGYADHYSRRLSSRGQMLLRGLRCDVLGRVCMQMSAVDVTAAPGVVPGDMAFLLGGDGEGALTAEELAAWWGTIPYEVFCVLGMNRREYG
jgi:alanine racemase